MDCMLNAVLLLDGKLRSISETLMSAVCLSDFSAKLTGCVENMTTWHREAARPWRSV